MLLQWCLAPIWVYSQVYRLRRKDQEYNDSVWEPEMKNYRDGPEVEKALQSSFEKEEKEGRMFLLCVSEARRRYPGDAFFVWLLRPSSRNLTTIFEWPTTGPMGSRLTMTMSSRIVWSLLERGDIGLAKSGAVSEQKVFFGIIGHV